MHEMRKTHRIITKLISRFATTIYICVCAVSFIQHTTAIFYCGCWELLFFRCLNWSKKSKKRQIDRVSERDRERETAHLNQRLVKVFSILHLFRFVWWLKYANLMAIHFPSSICAPHLQKQKLFLTRSYCKSTENLAQVLAVVAVAIHVLHTSS